MPQLDLSPGLPLVLNTIQRLHIKPDQVVSLPRPWHVLDYVAGAKTSAQARIELPVTRTATGHGLGIWFETQLIEDIGCSHCSARGRDGLRPFCAPLARTSFSSGRRNL